MKRKIQILAVCLSAMAVISSCKKSSDDAASPSPSLYSRVGGSTMVADPAPANSGQMIEKGRLTLRAVVDSSILVIAADGQLSPYFSVLLAELGSNNTTGLTNLSKNLTDFLCVATGSKHFTYGGRDMQNAHDPNKNSRISKFVDYADFNKFVGDIGIGLAKNGVTTANNPKLVNDLVALLNTTKTDVTNLYARVGGTTLVSDPTHAGQMIEQGRLNLRAVVDSTIFIIAADNQLNPYFNVLLAEVGAGNLTGFNALSTNLTDFLCVATGAKNFTYTGDSMKDAHNPAKNTRISEKVSSADFDKFVGDVVAGLAKNGITTSNNADLVSDLGTLLYTVEADVVQR